MTSEQRSSIVIHIAAFAVAIEPLRFITDRMLPRCSLVRPTINWLLFAACVTTRFISTTMRLAFVNATSIAGFWN